MKRPSFQFYPGDWLKDTALRTCSVGARGLWMDIICWMHEGTPYGHLKVNHKVILPINLSRMVGATLLEVEGWLEELEGAGVFSRDEQNCIYSKRMIRDEEIRKARAEGGILGGNPKLIGENKVRDKVNLQPNLQPTPSSSSSSSSSTTILNTNTMSTKPDLVGEVFEYWQTKREHPKSRLDKKRSTAIKARLQEGYTVERIKDAIDGIGKSKHHMGLNPGQPTIYDDIELICRSGANVDKFADLKDKFVKPKPVTPTQELVYESIFAIREYPDLSKRELKTENVIPTTQNNSISEAATGARQ